MRPMSDLIFKDGAPDGANHTREIHSKTEGYLGSITAEEKKWLGIFGVSLEDHLTEPRTVEDYFTCKGKNHTTRWCLMWKPAETEMILGYFTNQEGAERCLAYLKTSDTM